MRYVFVFLALFIGLFSEELKIVAASNLKQVLEEVKSSFLMDYPQVKISISYTASGKAYNQIKNGLEVDIFFSADELKPLRLYEEGFGLNQPKIYALGKLALITAGNFNISTDSILTSSKVKHIAIANPKLAPYGEAGVAYLKNIHLFDKVQNKLVQGDSISQALSFVKTQGAEVGINALSLVIFDKTLSYRILDPLMYPPIKQAVIILKSTKAPKLSEAFVRFVVSNDGQKIFEKYGYGRNE